jgi:hypothetical protein
MIEVPETVELLIVSTSAALPERLSGGKGLRLRVSGRNAAKRELEYL